MLAKVIIYKQNYIKQWIVYDCCMFHVMYVILLIFYNFSKHNIKAPEDGAEAPKHVGNYVV
jgi:hypothetical protein